MFKIKNKKYRLNQKYSIKKSVPIESKTLLICSVHGSIWPKYIPFFLDLTNLNTFLQLTHSFKGTVNHSSDWIGQKIFTKRIWHIIIGCGFFPFRSTKNMLITNKWLKGLLLKWASAVEISSVSAIRLNFIKRKYWQLYDHTNF